MNANEKIRARYRAREAQAKANDKRYRRDRANADDAATIRVMLHRVGAVDTWERKAAEHVSADAAKRRASYFSGLQAAVDQMRDRGQTLAKIATLVEVDVREIQAALRRARTGGNGGHRAAGTSGADPGSTLSDAQGAKTDSADPTPDVDDRRSSGGDGAGQYDPTRCIRCDAVMLDADEAPTRRGRRRVYCSDTCRRDASAARTAAARYGSPIRVVEVPRAGSCVEQTAENALPESSSAITPLEAADITLRNDEALQMLLARVTEQARLKKLNRATFTVVRELAKAVHPHRIW